ncbi:leucyl aminopeptidase family protein, partial [bacterium]|nr:leucyl aminopeptidase family protein [bacterium]
EKVDIAVEKFSATLKKNLEMSECVAEAVNFARYLGDCPGNFMTPTQLGKEAEGLAKGTSLKVQVWDKKRIEKERMESFLGVSYGSDQEPKFICMEYKGGGAKQKPICFVGKGLTFDSGGISLKPGAGMEEMKFDMCGGAAVIATMGAIAKMKLKINAIAFVPATENMPGPSANKPGDIRKARNGKTIEVNNTDAEGRLILADALVYACEKKPALIADAATLTGAMMIALGNVHTGFYTRNEKLRKKVEACAESCGERVWAMPLVDDHVKDMKGYYADLTNLAPSRNAGSATAAAFLESFVDKDIPWAHFDIAGTAWNVSGRLPYITTKGASGAIVRTFIEMAKNHK